MPMIPPERTASGADRLIDPFRTVSLSTSSSDSMLEEKKSMDGEDRKLCFQKELIMDKRAGRPEYRAMVSNEPGSKFLPEKNRYVLYVSRACPNSHCALMVRTLKGLEDVVAVKYVQRSSTIPNEWVVIAHEMPDDSLASLKSEEGEFQRVRDIYQHEHDNRIPLLYDPEHQCIVNNNGNEIATMMNSAFNELVDNATSVDLMADSNEKELQDWLYPLLELNPPHYNLSPRQLEYAFQRATTILQKQRYLSSDISMADLRLFAALIRHDASELLHNKVLMDYCRDIYHGVEETVCFDEIQKSTGRGNRGLMELLSVPHQREKMSGNASIDPELQNWLHPLLEPSTTTTTPCHYQQLEYAFSRATTILQKQRYLASHHNYTAADIRFLKALIQYEAASAQVMQCPPELLHNKILMDYCRDLYQQPGVATMLVKMEEIRMEVLGKSGEDEGLVELLEVPHRREQLVV